MHDELRDWIWYFAIPKIFNEDTWIQRVLEIGSKNHNGGFKDLLKEADMLGSVEYFGIDIEPGEGVDKVIKAQDFFPKENGFGFYDLVVCTEVLEHEPDPGGIFDCAKRSLKSGGFFLLSCGSTGRPQHSSDGGPLKPNEYYGNLSTEYIIDLALEKGFNLIMVNYSYPPGDCYAVLELK